MRTAAPAIAAAALVLIGAVRHRPPPDRVRRLVPPGERHRSPRSGPVTRLGARIRGLAGRPPDPADDERVGRALVVSLVVSVVAGPVPGLAVGLATFAVPWWRARRRAADARQLEHDEVPDAVDLLLLAVDAGLTPRLAIAAVADHLPGPVGGAFGAVLERVAVGVRLADALEVLVQRLGDPVRPLVAVLADAERYGMALAPGLERVAAEARADRRRRAEAAARTVPVRLLFPLVACTLPAFALVTVVPLLAGSLDLLVW